MHLPKCLLLMHDFCYMPMGIWLMVAKADCLRETLQLIGHCLQPVHCSVLHARCLTFNTECLLQNASTYTAPALAGLLWLHAPVLYSLLSNVCAANAGRSAVKDTDLELISEAEFLEKAPAELKEGLTAEDGKPDSYKHQLMLRRLQHEKQCRIEVQAAASLNVGRAAACLKEAVA